MKKQLLILSSLILLSCFPALAQQKKDTVQFEVFPKGRTAQADKIVNSIWLKDPAYAQHVHLYDMPPDHMTGVFDINDDGVQEVFARHSDPESRYCDKDGYTCLLIIYQIGNNQAKEIGRFMAGPDVVILPEKTGGYHNILSQDSQGHLKPYLWNGVMYAAPK